MPDFDPVVFPHRDLTERVIGAFFDVYNELGFGFLESVYHRSMVLALTAAGLHADSEAKLPVYFRGEPVGDFEADVLVERAVILSDGPELAFDPGWLAGGSAAETARTWAAQERQRILDALRAAGGRVYGPGGAAHRLGLKPTTLYGKMRKHGLDRTDVG